MGRGLVKFSQALQKLEEERPSESFAGVEQKELHYNYLQLICLLIGAQYMYGIAGRGTGKSEGILAMRLHRLVEVMPRASIVAIGTTYVQLLVQTLPALFKGMHRLGYVRDQDYWVGRLPDRSLNLELPYNTPMEAQYSIFIRNPGKNSVSALRLVGQDRPGSANGLSVNALIGDEVRFLNKQKLDNDVLAINRGDEHIFGGLAEHHSICFTTDRPMRGEAEWLKNNKEESLKPEHVRAIELILSIQLELYEERQKLAVSTRNGARLKRIAEYERMLNDLRRGLVHMAEASSFANVHVLGLEYFRKLFREMPPDVFKARILNEEVQGSDQFYPDFNPQHHYYDSVNYSHIDTADFQKYDFNDCRKDADLDHSQPLTIGMDYGDRFNCMTVGQRISRLSPLNTSGRDEVRHLKGFHVEKPGKVQHVVKKFADYYQYFYKKEVVYVYDPTAKDSDGKSEITYHSEVVKALKAAGWRVREKYLRKVPGHHIRYLAWGVALAETDPRYPLQRFNRDNMRIPCTAMQNAKSRQTDKGFKKDKRQEGIDEVDQSTTTHYTDAVDTVFWYLTIVAPNQQDILPASFSR
jgi:hypothetical protein